MVGADLDDGIRESGIPDKVRMPRRYVKAAQAAHRRVQTRAVDSGGREALHRADGFRLP